MSKITYPEQTDEERFFFDVDGTRYELPSVNALPAGYYRKARRAVSRDDQMFIMLEEAASQETLDALDRLSIGDLNDFYVRWGSHSDLAPRDFSEPSAHSTDTEEPSSATSPSASEDDFPTPSAS